MIKKQKKVLVKMYRHTTCLERDIIGNTTQVVKPIAFSIITGSPTGLSRVNPNKAHGGVIYPQASIFDAIL